MARKAYLSNADLLAEIIVCREVGKVSSRLATMLMLLVNRYAMRPNFRNYSYLEEMKADALMMLATGILKFDPAKSSSAFGYATQIAKNAMVKRLKAEQKHQDLRDNLIIEGYYTGGKYGNPSDRRVMEDLITEPPPLPRGRGRPRKA